MKAKPLPKFEKLEYQPTSVRLPPDLKVEVKAAARVDERTFNQYIIRALRAAVERTNAEQQKKENE